MSVDPNVRAAHDVAVLSGHYTLGAAALTVLPAVATALLGWWRRHSLGAQMKALRAEHDAELRKLRDEALAETKLCRAEAAHLRECIAALIAAIEVGVSKNSPAHAKVAEIRLLMAHRDGRDGAHV